VEQAGQRGGYNYIGIYGWTVDPLVEYYIVDDWFSNGRLWSKKGEFTVDGATYEVLSEHALQRPPLSRVTRPSRSSSASVRELVLAAISILPLTSRSGKNSA
jgi:Glycosyl hydrolases family 11.